MGNTTALNNTTLLHSQMVNQSGFSNIIFYIIIFVVSFITLFVIGLLLVKHIGGRDKGKTKKAKAENIKSDISQDVKHIGGRDKGKTKKAKAENIKSDISQDVKHIVCKLEDLEKRLDDLNSHVKEIDEILASLNYYVNENISKLWGYINEYENEDEYKYSK